MRWGSSSSLGRDLAWGFTSLVGRRFLSYLGTNNSGMWRFPDTPHVWGRTRHARPPNSGAIWGIVCRVLAGVPDKRLKEPGWGERSWLRVLPPLKVDVETALRQRAQRLHSALCCGPLPSHVPPSPQSPAAPARSENARRRIFGSVCPGGERRSKSRVPEVCFPAWIWLRRLFRPSITRDNEPVLVVQDEKMLLALPGLERPHPLLLEEML